MKILQKTNKLGKKKFVEQPTTINYASCGSSLFTSTYLTKKKEVMLAINPTLLLIKYLKVQSPITNKSKIS